MSNPTLIVMAAGMGSRYGGLKQLDPVGPNGEIILDYSVHDAIKAGFDKVVFVIRRDMEDAFRQRIGRAMESRVDVAYAVQEITNIPTGFRVPDGRAKPWGTGHAVLSAKSVVTTPCAAVNADDYYGATAFRAVADHLKQAQDRDGIYDYCMAGYILRNTLSENGYVARGICEMTTDGLLAGIHERTHIERFDCDIRYTENGTDWIGLSPESVVSLNMWGFTVSIFSELEAGFAGFLRGHAGDLTKAEYFLPSVVGELITEGKARVKVLPTSEKWFGVTYREDRPVIQAAIRDMIARGLYPERLAGHQGKS